MFQKEQMFTILTKKDMNCPFTGIHYYLRVFYRFCKILLFKYLKNHSYSFSIIIYLTNSLEKCPRIMDTTKLSIYSKNWISILYLASLSLFPFIVGFSRHSNFPTKYTSVSRVESSISEKLERVLLSFCPVDSIHRYRC